METQPPGGGATAPPRTNPRTRMIRFLVGAALGGVAGYAYYRFVGCSSGACPLTSNPWISTAYGMLVGGMIASS